jgi:Fis family transcriptional regulator
MSKKNIQECIKDNLEGYFQDLRGAEPHAVYDMVVNAVERPMLEVVMLHSRGQPVQGGRLAGHQPQHPAPQAARTQTHQVNPALN